LQADRAVVHQHDQHASDGTRNDADTTYARYGAGVKLLRPGKIVVVEEVRMALRQRDREERQAQGHSEGHKQYQHRVRFYRRGVAATHR